MDQLEISQEDEGVCIWSQFDSVVIVDIHVVRFCLYSSAVVVAVALSVVSSSRHGRPELFVHET